MRKEPIVFDEASPMPLHIKMLLFVVLVATFTAPATARPFTPRDLLALSRISNPTVSPDGHWLVWEQQEANLAANEGHHSLWRLDLIEKDAAPEKISSDAHAEDRDPAFGPNGQLYFLSNREAGKTTVWQVAMTGGEPVQVTKDYDLAGFKVSPTGDAILVWTDRPVGAKSLAEVHAKPAADQGSARIYDRLFVRHWNKWADGQRSQLFVIPMVNGRAPGAGHAIEAELMGDSPQKPSGGGEQIAWSRDGRTVYFALREAGRIEPLSSNLDIFAASADGSKPPANLTASNRATDTLPTVSPDGRWLAWTATKRPGFEDDRQVLMLREIATGSTRVITENWDRSIESIVWDTDSSTIYVTAKDTMDEPAFRVAVSDGEVHRLTGAGHVSGVVVLPRGGFIYMLDGLTAPADFWRCDAAGHTVQLTHVNAEKLQGIDWPTVTRFTFQGANRDTVWGLVLRPAGLARAAKAPIAFVVHGGPQGSLGDIWVYGWNLAAWSGHGYAVVSLDFHGSVGYGQVFTDAVNRDWGGKPLVDLKLGLKAAVDRFDFLDGAHACALGGSYGGYMMNWIEGMWPDRFQCLVQHDGVFDARAMNYETDELFADDWDYGGHPYYENPDEYEKWNPVNHVAKWKTPQLVITGEKDFRNPSMQAVAAFTALQRRDVPSRLLVFPDEGHRIQKPRNSLQWYSEVFDWMDRWTGSEATEP